MGIADCTFEFVTHVHCLSFCLSDNAISSLLDELPDELANFANPSPGGTQNGARDPSMSHHDNTSAQKHQQLSQLLASNSSGPTGIGNANRSSPQNQGPCPSPGVGGLGNNLNNLNNAVKSPLSHNLSSPPHVPVNKTGPTSTPHSMNNDIMTSAAFISSGNVTSSSVLANMSMASTLNSKPMTSQPMKSTAGGGMHQNQMMNGPHLGMGPVGGVPRTVASSMNMIGSAANLVNSLAAGQLGVGASQGLNHPGLNTPQQLMKVSFYGSKAL